MRFERLLSTTEQPFGGVQFVPRDSRIVSPTGTIIFEQVGLLAPEGWSQTAVDTLAQKYFRKAGVPSQTERVPEKGIPEWLQPCRPVSGATFGRETDAREVFARIAGHWTYTGYKLGYFSSDEDAQTFFHEMCAALALQMIAPNSPQWFNTGLWWAYGIESDGQELFAVPRSQTETARPQDAAKISESYRRPMSYACFIQSVQDQLVGDGSILDLAEREAKVFKFGGGSGTNFSALRGKNEKLNGGGHSSGVMSWLGGFDRFAGAIKSGGTTRRAAKMVILDEDHPEILDFVTWKAEEEDKVAALVAGSVLMMNHANAIVQAARKDGGANPKQNPTLRKAVGSALRAGIPGPYVRRILRIAKEGATSVNVPVFDCDWQGEAYRTVSGQNGNNTVRLSDVFMSKVAADALDEPHHLYGRLDLERTRSEKFLKPMKTIKVGELWDAITSSAWKSADPGTHYAGTVAEWHTCPEDGEIRATNPCSEFVFLDDTGCNLASVNAVPFLLPDGSFDVAKFKHVCRMGAVALDITVSMSSYPSAKIAAGSHNFRTIGLGYANVGGLLMRLGVPYDSNTGREIIAAVTCLLHSVALTTSSELANRLGTFPNFAKNRSHCLRVVHNHAALASGGETVGLTKNCHRLNRAYLPDSLVELGRAAVNEAKRSVELANRFGLRNAQVTNIAPTGTIGIVMDCDTTGIEPDFALVKYKSLAGGGYFKLINQSVPVALARLGYSPDQVNDIVSYVSGHRKIDAKTPHYDKLTAALGESKISESASALGNAVDVRHIFPALRSALTAEEVRAVNVYVCGAMTTEGAPHLREEHYPVFDCANRCGIGTRSISVSGHILAMAAAQSWVSGAISKTINMPADATKRNVADAYILSWQRNIKCMALYVDDSKLSQPLGAGDTAIAEAADDANPEQVVAERIVTRFLGTRRPLPDRRAAYRQKVRLGRHKLYISTGEYPDGTLGELFVDMHKEGAAFRSLVNAFCIAVSLGLQHGVPLSAFVDKFTFMRFEPNGPVQNHARIKNATSLIDLVFRELAITYLGRDDLAHVAADEMPASLEAEGDESDVKADAQAKTRVVSRHAKAVPVMCAGRPEQPDGGRDKGYTGNACPNCGNFTMTRAGSCERCETCGTTSGCS